MNPGSLSVETKIRLDRFKPRDYQLPLCRAFEEGKYKRFLAIWARRSGKDICAFNLMLRAAIRRVGVYYYVFPTYSQARKVIWDSITNSGQRFLDYIPKELIKNTNSTEMKIYLINGSLLQLIGSDNIDALMGTNPMGIVFSEYGLQDPAAYQFLRPILLSNGGWSLSVSCVSPATLVLTEEGFSRIHFISNSRAEYSDLNKKMYGLGGFHNAEQFYYGGKQKTLKIQLESGYELECTTIHPIWNGSDWIKSQNLRIGDLLVIQYGQSIWGTGLNISDFHYEISKRDKIRNINTASRDFFYLLGLIHADGNYTDTCITITKKKDHEIIDFLQNYDFRRRKDGIHHDLSSKMYCSLLEYIGFKHGAKNKTFPDKLLSCTKEEMISFLQGIFDGDGCSASNEKKRGRIKLSSSCKEFIQDLQVILLNFGICSGIRYEDSEPQGRIKVNCRIYNLEITGYFAHIFYRDIGFRLHRKQKNWQHIPKHVREESGNLYPVNLSHLTGYSLPKNIVKNPKRISRRLIKKLHTKKPHSYLKQLLDEKLFYSPIKSITPGENEVFDFVIPETHSFFSNGYLSHNTPRGKNHLFELYQIAKNSPDWFCSKLGADETQHISLFEIQKEIAEGLISEDVANQEYFCSFESGIEGAYYAKYIDKMRIAGQIGIVPYEYGFKVHTAWDLGVRDSTSIIFFQVIGQTVRIIDYYEKNKEGLEHYAKILESKEYSYGRHIFPHDVRVMELGSGITRIEKLRQLGIKATIADDVSIVDGIEAVRSSFSKIWIDEVRCKTLIKALENYRQEWDSKKKVYNPRPLHDIHSHAADCIRYLCISLPKTRDGLSSEDLDKRYAKAVYGSQSNLPPIFRDDLPSY